ncbi:MAG: hypothetical protein WCE45_01830 [Sedimentisphaerales bacterium]
MPEPKTKCCTRCGTRNPLKAFGKNRRQKDGLAGTCKKCQKKCAAGILFPKSKKNNNPVNQNDLLKRSIAGINDYKQINSVLREMAESQIAIDRENAALEEKLNRIKSESAVYIEPVKSHQTTLRLMLETFLKKIFSDIEKATRLFEFGIIYWNNGIVSIKLNTELAENRMDKP